MAVRGSRGKDSHCLEVFIICFLEIARFSIFELNYSDKLRNDVNLSFRLAAIDYAYAGILGAFMVVPILSTIRFLVGCWFSKVAQRDPFRDKRSLPTFIPALSVRFMPIPRLIASSIAL